MRRGARSPRSLASRKAVNEATSASRLRKGRVVEAAPSCDPGVREFHRPHPQFGGTPDSVRRGLIDVAVEANQARHQGCFVHIRIMLTLPMHTPPRHLQLGRNLGIDGPKQASATHASHSLRPTATESKANPRPLPGMGRSFRIGTVPRKTGTMHDGRSDQASTIGEVVDKLQRRIDALPHDQVHRRTFITRAYQRTTQAVGEAVDAAFFEDPRVGRALGYRVRRPVRRRARR